MRVLCAFVPAVLAMLTPPLAFAGERVLQASPGNAIRLYDMPCVHGGTLGHIKPEFRDKFKKADITENGEKVYGCWIEDEDGDYFVMLEDGRGGSFFRKHFKESPEV